MTQMFKPYTKPMPMKAPTNEPINKRTNKMTRKPQLHRLTNQQTIFRFTLGPNDYTNFLSIAKTSVYTIWAHYLMATASSEGGISHITTTPPHSISLQQCDLR
jgi:hypothetical protein